MARLETNPYKPLPEDRLKDPVVFVIDMVKGFTSQGALADPAIEQASDAIARLIRQLDCTRVFVCDSHPPKTREFESYPPHCIIGTTEAEISDSLKDFAETVIPKNSTNTFMAPAFQAWLKENKDRYQDWIITGCCTDLCILQFVLSLQSWMNEHNESNKRILVPVNCVDTYDIGGVHEAAFWNAFALQNMACNGVSIVSEITE